MIPSVVSLRLKGQKDVILKTLEAWMVVIKPLVPVLQVAHGIIVITLSIWDDISWGCMGMRNYSLCIFCDNLNPLRQKWLSRRNVRLQSSLSHNVDLLLNQENRQKVE